MQHRCLAGLLLLAAEFCGPSQAATPIQVQVLDIDTKKGIETDIIRISAVPGHTPQKIGETDDSGLTTFDASKCADGDTITVKPVSANYPQPSREKLCLGKPKIVIGLRASPVSRYITMTALNAEKNGKFLVAAQAYTEIHAVTADPEAAAKVYKNIALGLGLPADKATIFDPAQKSQVPSPALIDAVKKFQQDNGLKPDGVLGAETLRVMAHGPAAENLFKSN